MVGIEARREIKAKWRAEREKSRRARWERKIKKEESERDTGPSNVNGKREDGTKGRKIRKGTILRVTFSWGGIGKR